MKPIYFRTFTGLINGGVYLVGLVSCCFYQTKNGLNFLILAHRIHLWCIHIYILYTPIFTIEINHSCRYRNMPVPWLLWVTKIHRAVRKKMFVLPSLWVGWALTYLVGTWYEPPPPCLRPVARTIYLDLLVGCLEKVQKILSQMVVWWWFTLVESKKSS